MAEHYEVPMKRTPIGIFGRLITAAVPAAFVAFVATVFSRGSLLPPFGGPIVLPTVITYAVVFLVLWFVPERRPTTMKLVDPEQRLRVIKGFLVLSVAIGLCVYGCAYIYQHIWPKKPILINPAENG